MSHYTLTTQITAPFAIAVGLFICVWGYRILKLTLGIMGFASGAVAGAAISGSVAPGANGIALVCAIIGGILGAVLCVWLYFFGIFLLGASLAPAVAAAVYGGTGHQIPPLALVLCAVVFGLLALVMQKFVIIFSTAFTGSYLITAGVLHVMRLGNSGFPLWFDHSGPGPNRMVSYGAMAFWIIIGLFGLRVQYGTTRKKPEASRQEAKTGAPS